jgi:hypothetical protein
MPRPRLDPDAATPEDRADVDRLLGLAGLPASDHERQILAAGRPLSRRSLAALWDLPEARYAEPALIMQAAPALDTWE